MPGGKTAAHRELERRALLWAQRNQWPFAAPEVSIPGGRYRIDVAAAKPGRERRSYFCERSRCNRVRSAAVVGPAAIFECKAARADFLKDSADFRATLERLEKLAERRRLHEEWLKERQPALRVRDGLFAEDEQLSPEGSRQYESLRLVLEEIDKLQRRLFGRTKFSRLRAMRFATRHYVVAMPGVVRAHELPPDWGLLEPEGEEELVIREEAAECDAPEEGRLILLQRIALAGSRYVNNAYEIAPWLARA